MRLGKYKSINEEYVRDTFDKYINALEIPVIDYVAIGVQDSVHKTSASLMSRPDWQSTFSSLNLAESDPVRKAAFNTKTKFFSFDELDYQDSSGKEVMRQRKRHYIENGIVVMHRNLGHNFMLTLATGYKNFSAKKFYLENHHSIKKIFDDLIDLIIPYSSEFQTKIITNHQDVGAK